MSDVYVPERGDRYHLYKDCADLGFGQLGNTAQGLGTHNVAPMPLDQAEALKRPSAEPAARPLRYARSCAPPGWRPQLRAHKRCCVAPVGRTAWLGVQGA